MSLRHALFIKVKEVKEVKDIYNLPEDMTGIKLVLTLVFFCGLPCDVCCTTSSTATSTSINSTTSTGMKTTTKPVVQSSCENTTSCSDCTTYVKCYWCGASDTCKEYPAGSKMIPRDCSWNNWYWKQCIVPGYVLIIVVPTVCGVILLSIGCCIYCCCCRNRSSRKYEREDSKFRQRKEEIRQRNAERRAERKLKTDSIRKKYGLLKDEDDDDAVA